MKYIIAVRYKDPDDALHNDGFGQHHSEIFEFNSKEDRASFVKSIGNIAKEIAFSQIEEEK